MAHAGPSSTAASISNVGEMHRSALAERTGHTVVMLDSEDRDNHQSTRQPHGVWTNSGKPLSSRDHVSKNHLLANGWQE